jgi:hypothetical protein
MCSLAAIVKYKKGQWQGHPLEISGQAGKENLLDLFYQVSSADRLHPVVNYICS